MSNAPTGEYKLSADLKRQYATVDDQRLWDEMSELDDIPVTHITAYGKKWIFEPYSLTLQCAYCINLQHLKSIRDDTGLVTFLRMIKDDESHTPNCPQHEENFGK